jgi:hypothetical protein
MNRLRFWLLAFVVVTVGCGSRGSTDPKTYAVTGTVQYQNGSPFPGGLIEFRSTTQAGNALGNIAADGSFSLHTLHNRKRLVGAAEGTYQVTITPRMGQDQTTSGVPIPIELQDTFTVKPEANKFTITIPQPRR